MNILKTLIEDRINELQERVKLSDPPVRVSKDRYVIRELTEILKQYEGITGQE